MNYDTLPCRHIGISGQQEKEMLKAIGVGSMDELIDKVMPHNIRLKKDLDLAPAMTEREFAEHMMKLAYKNKIYKSYIGLGWYDTATPAVIQRNIFENPVWYTSYTPYQAEISQGRLEALLNFPTLRQCPWPTARCSMMPQLPLKHRP